MKVLLQIEELALFGLAALLFGQLGEPWWLFVVLVLLPDLGMLGYLGGPRVGALTYNLIHHKGVAVALYAVGALTGAAELQVAGTILLAHSSLDRVFGFGLKHADSFQHTHLGRLGRPKA